MEAKARVRLFKIEFIMIRCVSESDSVNYLYQKCQGIVHCVSKSNLNVTEIKKLLFQ